ncbi:hypothetical protein ACWDYJ_13135 [Streptomyces sp. NPDC003042]
MVGRLGGGVLEAAQPFVGEIEGFYVGTRRLQSAQRRHVDPGPWPGRGLLVVVLGFRARVREQLLGHRGLLVRGGVVRLAPCGAGDGGAQFLPPGCAGEDGPVVAQRDAGYLPLPRRLVGSLVGGRCARVGRGVRVRVGCDGGRGPGGLEVGQGPWAVERR